MCPLYSPGLWMIVLTIWLAGMAFPHPAVAAGVDPYVTRYLRVTEPIALPLNDQGQTRLFSPADLSVGKRLFGQNCQTCHVGGTTLPNPQVSLSLADLRGAMPARDRIDPLVAYFRQPMTYDGREVADWCRSVPESWMSQAEVENLAAFVLKAAQSAPGWGTETFE